MKSRINIPEAESDEAATPNASDIERSRVRAAEYDPLVAAMLDAEVVEDEEE